MLRAISVKISDLLHSHSACFLFHVYCIRLKTHSQVNFFFFVLRHIGILIQNTVVITAFLVSCARGSIISYISAFIENEIAGTFPHLQFLCGV